MYALALVCGALVFAPCDIYAPPMGGPYEGPTTCTAGVVEVGPGRYTHDVLSGATITTVELDTAEINHPPCP